MSNITGHILLSGYAKLPSNTAAQKLFDQLVVVVNVDFESGIVLDSRGTAYHKLLELLDFSKDYDADTLASTIATFVSEGLLSEEMAACICVDEILAFLGSAIGKRVQAAERKGTYHAEQPFVMGFEAREIYKDADAKECVLVQGIVDVYFEEDGELVVLDYKTDKVRKPSELAERYHTQLDYYAKALGELTGKPVKEKVIYSFTLQEEILC